MKDQLINYIFQIADSDLILGQRLSELCGHGPILEQDMAMTNIALDLIGEANYLYKYIADLKGDGSTSDSLAFLRESREVNNLLLVEQPNGNFADTIVRQYFFDVFHLHQMKALTFGPDEALREIAERAVNEVSYHLRFSRNWMLRLGDGTEDSHQKIQDAIQELYPYTGEMFIASPAEEEMLSLGFAPNLEALKSIWDEEVNALFAEINIDKPNVVRPYTGGKNGIHTEHHGFILSEMQFMQRAYPNLEW